MLHGLPLSYNLDLQEITPHIWDSCQITLSSIKIMTAILAKVKFNIDRLLELVTRDFSTATDLAEILVRELNVPFRTAHQIVGSLVRKLIADGKALEDLTPEVLGEIMAEVTGKKITVNQKILTNIVDPLKSISARDVVGGPAPSEVLKMIKARLTRIKKYENWYNAKVTLLKQTDQKLAKAINEISKK